MTVSGLFSPLRPLTLVCLFLWLFVVILLIAAAASPTMATGGGVRVGAFQVCYPDGGGCHSIDTDCSVGGGGGKVFAGGDCDRLQAVRAFLIMGLLLSVVITALTCYMFAAQRMAESTLYVAAHVLMAVETFFILIAFSVAAALLNDYSADKGGAFGCLVTAWVMGLIAWALWWAAHQYDQDGGRATLASAGMSLPSKTVPVETTGGASSNLQSVTVAPTAPTPTGSETN